METTTYNMIYLLSNFFTIFIIQRFMWLFFSNSEQNKLLTNVAYTLYFIVTSLVYILFAVPLITLALNCVFIFIISLMYGSTMKKRMMYSTYIIVFMLFPELIVGAVTGYLHFSFFVDGCYSNIIGIIVSKIMMFSEVLLLQNYKTSREQQDVSWNVWISSILIPITTLSYEIMLVRDNDLSQYKIILSVIILFVINISAFYLYDSLSKSYVRQSKLSILETENTLYSKQCEIMQSSTKELQEFRHDMNNQFIVLSQLIRTDQYEEAEKQLSHLTALTKSKIIYSTSGNIIVDGLINYKLQNALNDKIKVKTEIAVPAEMNIETTDLVAILGNLLDNALNALSDVPEDRRNITIKAVFSQGRLIIRTSNPYVGNVVCNNGKIVSSDHSPGHHGYGLNNIEKAVKKYKGCMNIDYTGNYFTVDILLYI